MRTILIFIIISKLSYGFNYSNKDSIYIENINYNENIKWEGWMVNFNKYLSFNNTQIINSLVGLEMGISKLFGDSYKISLGSAILGQIPFDSKNFNYDFADKSDLKSQYFMGITFNLSIHKYMYLNKMFNIFFGLGLEIMYSNGQSIYYLEEDIDNNGIKNSYLNGDLGVNYYFYYLYPQIGINFKKQKLDIYISYNHSINDQKIYMDNDKKYKISFFTIGLRGMIPF